MILLSHWITIFSILFGFWFWVLNRKQTYDLGFAVCFLLLTYVSAHFLVSVIDIAAAIKKTYLLHGYNDCIFSL